MFAKSLHGSSSVVLALRLICEHLPGKELTTESVARASMVKELFVDDEATPEETVAVEEAFARAGFRVTAERGLIPSPRDAERWQVVGTIAVPIPASFAALTDEETKDMPGAVKAWAEEIFEARRGSGGRPRGEIMLIGRLDTDITLFSGHARGGVRFPR